MMRLSWQPYLAIAILAALLASILAIIFSGCIPPPADNAPKTRRRDARRQAQMDRQLPISDAAALFREYDKNEIRGDKRFKGRRMALRGVIDQVNTDILGKPFVVLTDGSEWSIFGVQAYFDSAEALVELNPGDEITLVGTCSGKFGNVLLEDCRLCPITPQESSELPAGYRVWTSGNYVISAEFVSVDVAGKVTLRNEQGGILQVPLRALSQKDQDYVRSVADGR